MTKNEMKIKRHLITGKGPKFTYSIQVSEQELFRTKSGGFLSWTRKKHTQQIIDYINNFGIDATISELDVEKDYLVNLHLLK